MVTLRIGPYLAFVSKFWAGEDVITRSRTASGHVDGGGDLLWPEVECVEEELAMPLTTTGEPGYYEPSTDNIGFWMLNGTRERQRCAVTLEALEKLKTGLCEASQNRSDASILTAGVSNEWQARSSTSDILKQTVLRSW